MGSEANSDHSMEGNTAFSSNEPLEPSNITDTVDEGGFLETNKRSRDEMLPEKPVEPEQSDCCGEGCKPCVFDIYSQELELWEKQCDRIRRGLPAEQGTSKEYAVSPSEYRRFEIDSVHQDSLNTYTYRFTIPSGGSLGIKTGQYILLRHLEDGKELTRSYTPISDITAEGYFDVMIKIYEDGLMSQFVKTWRVGDMIEWRGPFGNFTYTPNKWRRVLMLAAGTGIAPMAQVIKTILNNEDDETFIRLCYACQKYEEILLKPSIDSWSDYWNFSVAFFLSKDSADRACKRRYGDVLHYNRINETVLQSELGEKTKDTLVLICGTESFDNDIINRLGQLGIGTENYFQF